MQEPRLRREDSSPAEFGVTDYLSGFIHRRPKATKAIAGESDLHTKDWYTLGILDRLSPSAFGANPNDLIVASESARADLDDTVRVVCDHFSYRHQVEVLETIDATVLQSVRAWKVGEVQREFTPPGLSYSEEASSCSVIEPIDSDATRSNYGTTEPAVPLTLRVVCRGRFRSLVLRVHALPTQFDWKDRE